MDDRTTTLESGDVEIAEEGSGIPDAVIAAKDGKVTEPGEMEMDATEWLLSADGPTDDEIEPTIIQLNVGSTTTPKVTKWQVVPLPDSEFRKFRKLVTGSRRTRRQLAQGNVADLDDYKYHLLVVAAATVSPDLRKVAEAKSNGGINIDVTDVLRHRFAAKPGLINQISAIVSDISGYDEADAEVVSGNS